MLDLPPVLRPHPPGLADCVNLPRCIALPVQHGLATLHEMNTVYGLEDCYDMLELMAVENYNAHQWREFEKKRP